MGGYGEVYYVCGQEDVESIHKMDIKEIPYFKLNSFDGPYYYLTDAIQHVSECGGQLRILAVDNRKLNTIY